MCVLSAKIVLQRNQDDKNGAPYITRCDSGGESLDGGTFVVYESCADDVRQDLTKLTETQTDDLKLQGNTHVLCEEWCTTTTPLPDGLRAAL